MLNNRQSGVFPYIDGFKIKEKSEEELEESEEKSKDILKKFIEYIENELKEIKYDLFEHYFNFSVPGA